MASKTIQTKVRDIKLLAELCKEMKIDQLKLPDGTCICMNALAFYEDVLPQQAQSTEKTNQSDNIAMDNQGSMFNDLDEETLLMSARG